MKCHVCQRGGRQKVQLLRVNSRNQKAAIYACAEHREMPVRREVATA